MKLPAMTILKQELQESPKHWQYYVVIMDEGQCKAAMVNSLRAGDERPSEEEKRRHFERALQMAKAVKTV